MQVGRQIVFMLFLNHNPIVQIGRFLPLPFALVAAVAAPLEEVSEIFSLLLCVSAFCRDSSSALTLRGIFTIF